MSREDSKQVRVLIGIEACHNHVQKVIAQAATWYKDVASTDAQLRVFYGRGSHEPWRDNEVQLDVPDDYIGLSQKTRAICRWALEHDYDYLFKVDTDVYVKVPELLQLNFQRYDYSGHINRTKPWPWCSGFSYWLSKRALDIIANANIDSPTEDMWVAKTLNKHGIEPHEEPAFQLLPPGGVGEWPRGAVTICSMTGCVTMRSVHALLHPNNERFPFPACGRAQPTFGLPNGEA